MKNLLALFLLGLAVSAAAERPMVPTPAGGGPGVNIFPADQQNPLDRTFLDDAAIQPSPPSPGRTPATATSGW